jgi:hypothetical protein
MLSISYACKISRSLGSITSETQGPETNIVLLGAVYVFPMLKNDIDDRTRGRSRKLILSRRS